MPHGLRVVNAILLGATLTALNCADVPKFGDYPAQKTFHGNPAEPLFQPNEDRYPNGDGHFRGGVSFDAAKGPNFAGHYTLAIWTCGTDCSEAVVVDAVTGRIYRDMPFEMLVMPRRDTGQEYSFRLDSRLLIVQGYFDVDVPTDASECSRRYYEWTGSSFKLRRQVVLTRSLRSSP